MAWRPIGTDTAALFVLCACCASTWESRPAAGLALCAVGEHDFFPDDDHHHHRR
ncbi:uncharacterized protein K452DRAFT_288272 [Aplosporella prunicola CBS 121167]|uniref:Uncharacterized protein n=1 Tax=Aplosporella prunicola CBS 121167 TaxID=1176127 RepID=A0A6A6BD87_9PEZI|nr:uncharacterized protein K452DRAFT_288272 [Aplosporella prunicola CBS 121167]KAF2140867.1 hypothetical protein K452DRAFT_288272 [Aplosporella prunicola CBS 121167]